MNNSLKTSIVVSTFLHLILITPLYSLDIQSQKEKVIKNNMVVDYVMLDDEKASLKNNVIPKTREAREISIAKDKANEISPRKASSKKDIAKKQDIKSAVKKDDEKVGAFKETAKERQLRSSPDYISYYQLIRDKIKQVLKDNYKYYHNEGDVSLMFTLRSDGALMTYDIVSNKSTKDEILLQIAKVSLIEAAPFKGFPQGLNTQKMSFNVVVSFKKGLA